MRNYRLTLLGCALSWFMVGLHLPTLHAMTHEGHSPRASVVVATALLAVAALATLWMLFRAPRGGRA
jgi:hypothetical protein